MRSKRNEGTMIESGIHRITNEEYHSDLCPEPSLSRSTIADLINRTPAHARYFHPRLNPGLAKEESSTFDIGTAAHSLFLEGIDNCAVIDASDWRSKAAKEARDEAREAGKTPLLAHQYDKVKAMVEQAHLQLAASELAIKDLHSEGDSELSYIWQEQGVYCRVRPDWISHEKIAAGNQRKLILDLKTTGETADPSNFGKKAISIGYDIQEAFYRRGVHAVEGGQPPLFVFMIQETYEPFLCSFVRLDPAMQEMGKQKVDMGIHLWRICMSENNWPAYPSKVCCADTPEWAMAAWDLKADRIS